MASLVFLDALKVLIRIFVFICSSFLILFLKIFLIFSTVYVRGHDITATLVFWNFAQALMFFRG